MVSRGSEVLVQMVIAAIATAWSGGAVSLVEGAAAWAGCIAVDAATASCGDSRSCGRVGPARLMPTASRSILSVAL